MYSDLECEGYDIIFQVSSLCLEYNKSTYKCNACAFVALLLGKISKPHSMNTWEVSVFFSVKGAILIVEILHVMGGESADGRYTRK